MARAGLLDVRDKNIKEGVTIEDTGLEEAAAAIIYAAPRLARDVRELHLVRNMIAERFGKEFTTASQDNKNGLVPERVTSRLSTRPPSAQLVQGYLEEIARTYSVEWPTRELEEVQREVDDEDDDEGGKEEPVLAEPVTPRAKELNLGPLPPQGQIDESTKSPVSIAPPKMTTERPNPQVRLPGGGSVKGSVKKKDSGLGAPPTVDDLANRFKMLKK